MPKLVVPMTLPLSLPGQFLFELSTLSTNNNLSLYLSHGLCWFPCRTNVQSIIDSMDSHYDAVATSLARFRSSPTLSDSFLGLHNMHQYARFKFTIITRNFKLLRLKAHISKLLEDAEILFLVFPHSFSTKTIKTT